ncbi:MAG: MATE family efflux transporter [Oscillospiraceae bacterium]|nr:MATE family efflux transporter [Oscillospiraceae bacterium]
MRIKLSDHFSCKKMLLFTLPSIAMVVFTSIYSIVDGFFVSNFAGKTQFAAVNFVMPIIMIVGAIGAMFGSGGTALIAKTLGEKDSEKANRYFSMIVYLTIIIGIIFAVLGQLLLKPLLLLLGAEGEMLDYCITYGRIIIAFIPAYMLQYEFQTFFVLAEKSNLGLLTTIGAGVSNIVLDAVFVGILDFGLVGAATATVIGMIIGGVIPIIYFARKNNSLLRLGKTKFQRKPLLRTALNGSSEFVSNISMSVVGILFNTQLMKFAGENGVAAYGTLMYVNMIYVGIFFGYSMGISPVISFNYGAQNMPELKNIKNKSFMLIGITAVIMTVAAVLLSSPLATMFVGYDKELYDMTVHAFVISAFSFLFMGIPMFISAFFTSLNNGIISAIVSFSRTMIFQTGCVLILPTLFGLNGIWFSMIAAELGAAVISIIFLITQKRKYNY